MINKSKRLKGQKVVLIKLRRRENSKREREREK